MLNSDSNRLPFSPFKVSFLAIICRITNHRMTYVSQMYSYLMGASGLWEYIQKGVSIIMFYNVEFCACLCS